MENLGMEQAGTRDHHETTNKTNADVGGNSGTQIKRDEEEKCNICCNDVDVNQMHENMFCHHRYCFSCMAKHVEFKLSEGDWGIPKCPYAECNTKLTKDDCEKFLSSKWLQIFIKRLEEAKIPHSEKVYCPYSNCSALMALSRLDRCPQPIASSSSQPFLTTAATKCQKCNRLFCMECRVPWHNDMSCHDYASKLHGVDAELKLLAEKENWKQCPKCKHMIERNKGCTGITCRCGSGFCYECGFSIDYGSFSDDGSFPNYCKCRFLIDYDEDDDDKVSIDSSHHDEVFIDNSHHDQVSIDNSHHDQVSIDNSHHDEDEDDNLK